MDSINWWRVWVTSQWVTLLAAATLVAAMIRSHRREVATNLERVAADYERLHARLDRISDNLDKQQEQLLRILLHLYPDESARPAPP